MRKQKIILTVASLALILMSGCSQEQQTEAIDKDVLQAETLTVENDEFTFIELTDLIGKEEKEAEKLLGGQEAEESYQTQLFGDQVQINLMVEKETITGINIGFTTAGYEAVASAVAEQMGQDGEVEKNSYRWTYDDKEILLQEENTVMLYMEEVKSN